MTKRETLSRLHTDFLRELAASTNGDYYGSYRNYTGKSRNDLLNLLLNKLTSEDVDTIHECYLLCYSVERTTKKVKPDSVLDIQNAVEEYFQEESVYEVKIDNRRCDLVFPAGLSAVEIKSARDKVERSVEQVEDYEQWADQVYLAYDAAHRSRIPEPLENNGCGLLEYTDGQIYVKKKAELKPTRKDELISRMTYDSLVNIARKYDTSTAGRKKEIAERLAVNLSQEEARNEFTKFVKRRGALKI